MRVVMMATGPFALPTLKFLADSPHQLLAWITRPPKPAGRHQERPRSPLREFARERGLTVWEPEDINAEENVHQLAELGADVLVVCDYGRILSADVLRAAALGGINLHGSLLPKYRGAAPVQWAVYHGETETGVSVIHMSPELDAGPILVQRQTEIGAEETAEELEQRLALLGVEPVSEALDMLEHWDGRSPLGVPQDEQLASRAPRLKKEHGRVDFHRTAQQIVNQIRAFRPWPGTFTTWERAPGKSIKLILERAHVETPSGERAEPAPHRPGEVVVADPDRLCLATADAWLAVDRICPAGKRSQSVAEFMRGYRVPLGARWG